MTLSERSLLRLHLVGMLLQILILSGVLGGYFIYQQNQQFHADSRQLEQQALTTAQASLSGAMESLNNYLAQTRLRADNELRRELRHLIDSAWSIADGVYLHHGNDWSRDEMIQQVRESLQHMHFPASQGYYFMISTDDQVLLSAPGLHLEGQNVVEITDDQGHSIGRALREAVNNPEGEGFVHYRWKRPDTGEIDEKISFVRLYEPLGLIIGTGDYLSLIEQRIQQDVLQMLAATRIKQDGYFAVLTPDGRLLLSPAAPEATNRPLSALPAIQRSGLEAILATSRQGGGFVRYLWPKPGNNGEPQAKLSLVSNLESWGWILVSGLYLDDLEGELAQRQTTLQQLREDSMWASLSILGMMLMLSVAFSLLYTRWLGERFNRVRASLEASQSRVRQLRDTDQLTGLPNLSNLTRELEQRLSRKQAAHQGMAMLCIDLDHFKNINDALGHELGDLLLIQVANRISLLLHEQDLLCRVGGDEFIVLLDDTSNHEALLNLLQQLLYTGNQVYRIDHHELAITLSVGIALHPGDGTDAATLRRNADTALNHAKAQGRNNFQFYDAAVNRRVSEQMQMENQLRQAVARGELRLVYQPQVDLGSGQLVSCEALLRWHNPQLGEVSPAVFIPVAEEAGLIEQVGAWVLHEACRQAREWLDAGLPPLRIAVNVSARQFSHCDLPAMTEQALQHFHLPAACLELELTESVLATDQARLQQTLNALHTMGVHLSMDDFGTGFSSLSYLNQFRLDTLKIDRSFIHDLTGNAEHRALTAAILAMSNALGLNCVAEGVETEEQWCWLQQHGCQIGQGYLFARPLPPQELARLLAESSTPLQPLPATLKNGFSMDL